jgi:hypothetical protein
MNAVTERMARLWLATILAALIAFLFYGAGCTRAALDIGGDGGSHDCASLDEKGCAAAGSACVADYCSACSCTASFAACRRPSDPPYKCPLYGCPQPICDCTKLSETSCIAEHASLGCIANYCPDCNGGKSFVSCSNPGGGGTACPIACAMMTCHVDTDCKSAGQFCLAPGAPLCGGACRTQSCAGDGSCTAGDVCDFDPCACTNSGMVCVPGCSTAGCAEGQMCAQTNHCIAQFCSTPSDCPAQFECSSNQCQRKLCNDDTMCPGGFCVKNQCYSTLGTCATPAP